MHQYVMQELVRQRERELRTLAECYGLLGPRGWPRRRAGRRQNRGRIQLARTLPCQPAARRPWRIEGGMNTGIAATSLRASGRANPAETPWQRTAQFERDALPYLGQAPPRDARPDAAHPADGAMNHPIQHSPARGQSGSAARGRCWDSTA